MLAQERASLAACTNRGPGEVEPGQAPREAAPQNSEIEPRPPLYLKRFPQNHHGTFSGFFPERSMG
jgi:hypothetical protein